MDYFVQFVVGVPAAWWGSFSPAVSAAGTGEYDEGTEEGFLCVCVCVHTCRYVRIHVHVCVHTKNRWYLHYT